MVAMVSYSKSAAKNAPARGDLVATEPFFSRWSQRKLAREPEQKSPLELSEELACEYSQIAQEPCGSDHGRESPALKSSNVDEEQQPSVASLLLSNAAPALKKAALRKLFLSGEFDQVCMLDDYNADYRNTATLTTQVAHTLRQWCHETQTVSEIEQEQPPSNNDNALATVTLAEDSAPRVEPKPRSACNTEVESDLSDP
ncbi:DUF3306 domain-containing protein [Vibrio sp. HDW18]|uniref:DUF3306 domain-containing protein n=1 Tax=Vibrio sp. HDW18 TaxID=2714948 RepID=UPI00140DEEC9|nr:DUF3306 domain-containing protein [Vibrio sp. HDW18]QIL84433.1 DUF3306 domain-containing protein [Vibrio sp. HDW18]